MSTPSIFIWKSSGPSDTRVSPSFASRTKAGVEERVACRVNRTFEAEWLALLAEFTLLTFSVLPPVFEFVFLEELDPFALEVEEDAPQS